MESSYARLFSNLNGARLEGRLETVTQRQKEIQKIHSAIQVREEEFIRALKNDLQWNELDCLLELSTVLQSLRTLFDALDIKKSLANEHLIATTNVALTRRKPLGNVLIIAESDAPISQSIIPLCLAISEGNTAVVILSCEATQTSHILLEIIQSSENKDAIVGLNPDNHTELAEMLHALSNMLFQAVVVQNGTTRNEVELLTFRQASPDIQIIFHPPKRSSVIITRNANIRKAAMDVARAKFLFYSGRSLAAPGLILVDEFVLDEFLSDLEHSIRSICDCRPSEIKAKKYNMASETVEAVSNFLKGSSESRGRAIQINPDTSGETLLISSPNGCFKNFLGFSADEKQSKFGYSDPVLAIVPTTSTEAALTILNRINHREIPSMVQIFSNADEARYLSLFVDSIIIYLNHIPLEAAVCYYPTTLISTLSLLFSQSQLIYVPSSSASPSATRLQGALGDDEGKSAGLLDIVAEVLAPPKQKSGKRIGFFPQGAMVGMGHLAVLLTISVSGALWGVWSCLRG